MLSSPFSPSSSGSGPAPVPANGAGPRMPRPDRSVTFAWVVIGALSVAGVSLMSARAMHTPAATEAVQAAAPCQPVADDACACLTRSTERLDDETVYVAMGEALRVQAPRDVQLREAEQRRLCGVTTEEDTAP